MPNCTEQAQSRLYHLLVLKVDLIFNSRQIIFIGLLRFFIHSTNIYWMPILCWTGLHSWNKIMSIRDTAPAPMGVFQEEE